MKKNKVVFKVGEFKDYKGNVRKYVMAAVSIEDPNLLAVSVDQYAASIDNAVTDNADSDNYNLSYTNEIVKQLNVGVAVTNYDANGNVEEFKLELGKTIAEGKALRKPTGVFYATRAGMINEGMVKAVLEQESRFFETNPGAFLVGYNAARDKYTKNK